MLTIHEANKLVRDHGAILLDIRTKQEYCKSHICGAKLIETNYPPLNSKQTRELKLKLSHEMNGYSDYKPIIVYCKKGIRSSIAHNMLKELGFYNVYSLGGFEGKNLNNFIKGNVTTSHLYMCDCRNCLILAAYTSHTNIHF